ncbi:hypothetical protein T4B_8270 [Trichinella pseudospiralis]|uniref:Uncharacterized protein n=1 Tax=Trichinella pseudospiralis TaxID=6337 RepID=A0A0V1JDH9_TRIPS|nr:hypothetical protein T4B_8270 [Trichinella pseudospiralis]KRZ33046.1 hypothetical protein T4C_7256 [Trichinella pseudospiralis]
MKCFRIELEFFCNQVINSKFKTTKNQSLKQKLKIINGNITTDFLDTSFIERLDDELNTVYLRGSEQFLATVDQSKNAAQQDTKNEENACTTNINLPICQLYVEDLADIILRTKDYSK